MPTTCVTPACATFNAAGAEESGELGELHSPQRTSFPSRSRRLWAGARRFQCSAATTPIPDGVWVRDYVHVSSGLAEAHVLALRYLLADGDSVALNLGTGNGHSVQEALRTVESATENEIPLRWEPRRAGHPTTLVADPSRAEQVLGWTAQRFRRSLEEMVSAWKWAQLQQGSRRLRTPSLPRNAAPWWADSAG